MNADFGIISLLLLQLAGALACIFAAYHLHGQVTRVRDQVFTKAEVFGLLQKAEAGVIQTEANLREALTTLQQRTDRHAEKIRQVDIDAIEELRQKMRSLKGQLGALKRYANEDAADSGDAGDDAGRPAGESPAGHEPIQFPQTEQSPPTGRPPNFGRRVA